MKKVKLLMLALAVAGTAMLVGCDNPEKMKTMPQEALPKLDPNPLVLVGTKVDGKITGTFPPKYFHKKAKLELTPVIKYEGGELVLPSKMYQGESITENNAVISYDLGGPYSNEFSFEYKDGMMRSDVELRLSIYVGDKKVPFDEPIKVGVGINTTQLLADLDAQPTMLPHNFQRDRVETKGAQINFAIQKSDIRPGELNKEDVKALQNAIAELGASEKETLKGLTIKAYASPDGPVQLNDNLSKGRGQSTQNWLGNMLGRNKMDKSLASVTEESTDWDGFKTLVEQSDIEDKEMILRVLSMYSDPEVRNREMHNMGKVFTVIAEDILPKLRRAQMEASIEVKGRTDEEIKAMVDEGKIAELSLNEALFAVTLYPEAAKKAELYNAIAEQNKDIRVYCNLACIYINEGKYAEAKDALAKAAEIDSSNPVLLNNQGVIAMREGKPEEAEKLFVRATDAGEVVKRNLGACAILKGEYAAAVEYLSGTGSFNQGLALMLTDKNDAAKNTFNDLKTAKAYYGLAILGARTGDEKMVLDNLRNAVQMDSKLKERAKKDVEFIKYAANEVFAGLLK